MTCKTCEDCLHESVCASKGSYDYALDVSGYCTDFKNKVDFVEVIRCKDCKWWYNEMDCRNISGLYRFVPNGNWFCASGARK